MFNVGAAGEEDAPGGCGFGAAADGIAVSEVEIDVGDVRTGDEDEPRRGGAVAASLFSPSCLPTRGLPPLLAPRRPESVATAGSMACGSPAGAVDGKKQRRRARKNWMGANEAGGRGGKKAGARKDHARAKMETSELAEPLAYARDLRVK